MQERQEERSASVVKDEHMECAAMNSGSVRPK